MKFGMTFRIISVMVLFTDNLRFDLFKDALGAGLHSNINIAGVSSVIAYFQ